MRRDINKAVDGSEQKRVFAGVGVKVKNGHADKARQSPVPKRLYKNGGDRERD
jgi:hypothetical protein